ncbi:MAG: ribosomal L7Ae/L30e/S12e/Gadd45 family protein [Thermoanaerobacteraceae bacterium]|nr:ribosomal L7Ae/L30e/S12e/Gadd45 family protein [Thermoanaerobacteraceae bacterium]
MSLEEIKNAQKKTVGTKQTLKAVKKGTAKKVFVAEDAEAHVTADVIKLCKEKDIPLVRVPSMKELGKACDIKVGAATAAVLE